MAHATQQEVSDAVRCWQAGKPLDAREAHIDRRTFECLLRAVGEAEVRPVTEPPQLVRQESLGILMFDGAVFETEANFSSLHLPGEVKFQGVTFEHGANFSHTTFRDHADFDEATFARFANFKDARFDDYAGFAATSFAEDADFTAASFRDSIDLAEAHFAKNLDVGGARFYGATRLERFSVGGKLSLDRSRFDMRVLIEVTAPHLFADDARFAEGVRFLLEGGTVELERADLGRASMLSGAGPEHRPRLLRLYGAQVGGLTLSNVDLESCSFHGAHGLETMTIESNCLWPRPERRWHIDREMLAEEKSWYRQTRRSPRSRSKSEQSIGGLGGTGPADTEGVQGRPGLEPLQLASLYRALRKAREDNNDQAGAGDLYFGEMEMRRRVSLSRGPGMLRLGAEKTLIAAYWLLAGYGLRASRSLIALAVGGAVVSAFLERWGFCESKNYLQTLLYVGQSSVALIHPPEKKLTTTGEWLEIGIRIGGPALVALTILSLRSRIKR